MKVMIFGGGRVGRLVAQFLAETGQYTLYGVDRIAPENTIIVAGVEYFTLDIQDTTAVSALLTRYKPEAILNCLPFNLSLVALAVQQGIPYFDLTEDLNMTQWCLERANTFKSIVMPHCGIAPGIVNAVAAHLMRSLTSVESVSLRVGALPQMSNHGLRHANTWSLTGMVNAYIQPSCGLVQGELVYYPSLTAEEDCFLHGEHLEAFYTSGGLGSMPFSYAGKIQKLDYKSLRYPGHLEKMRFLLDDLELKHQKEKLVTLLENALPQIHQDRVILFVVVMGRDKHHKPIEKMYSRAFTATEQRGEWITAIQRTTALGLCTMLEVVLEHPEQYKGWVRQEQVSWEAIIENRFGQYFRE